MDNTQIPSVYLPKTGLIMGCFDLFHAGHVSLLEAGALRCQQLVVGLATDATVASVKGRGRPIISYKDRASVLAACRYVKKVVPFSLETQGDVLVSILPDICFSGVPGNPNLQQWIETYELPVAIQILECEVIHTSALIEKIRKYYD